MVRKARLLVIIILICSAAGAFAKDSDKTGLAVAAAHQWLATVDRGDFNQSWQDAAALFKGAVQVAQWEQSMKAARGPLGAVISRKMVNANHHTSLPGAPDGEYVVIQFATVFENKSASVETVTPMLDKDGHWRVSGYYIK